MKKFLTIVSLFALLSLSSCIRNNEGQATVKDLLIWDIGNRELLLDGTEGCSTTFRIAKANYDWRIIDYAGFVCDPNSGTKIEEGSPLTITVTPISSNNSADTIRLSDINFKMLSTRFVGISAYQLPQIRLSQGNRVNIDATHNATTSIKFVSRNENIKLVVSGDISAKLSEKSDKNEYTITISSTTGNTSAHEQAIGTIGFKADGIAQGGVIEVYQKSIFDRSSVVLPGVAGGANSFSVESNLAVTATSSSSLFSITQSDNNNFIVTATTDNPTEEMRSLGAINIQFGDDTENTTSIEVVQRKAKAPQTIIVHFIGTALQYYYNHNISKMLEALSQDIQGDAQVVVITTDSTTDATLHELRYDATLGKAVKERVKELSLPTPYDAEILETNIREAMNFAPAEKYALVIGSHGLGWIPKSPSSTLLRKLSTMGLSPDNLWQRNDNAAMTRHIGDETPTQYDVQEIASAIKACGVKFDYILFDSCYMGNVESVYELRDVTNYIIGSPCEVMGYGFPYAKIVPFMLNNGTSAYNLDKVCSEFVEYYRTTSGIPCGTVALTNCSELEALAQAMKAVNEAGVKADFSLDNVQYFDGKTEHSFYDLGDLVEQSCADATVAAAFKNQLDKTVTSRYHTKQFYSGFAPGNNCYFDINYYSGISTSAMVEHYAADWEKTEWYKATH